MAARIDPPFHVKSFLSAKSMIPTFVGANEAIYLLMRSQKPGKIVEAPLITMFYNSVLLTSISHFFIA